MHSILENERTLLQRVAEDDGAAFREIFDHYKGGIYSVALRLTKSVAVAEELSQEVFVGLWVSRVPFSKAEDPGAYIYKSLYNKISRYLKNTANHARILASALEQQTGNTLGTEEQVAFNEGNRLLHEAIERLPPQRRMVYRLSRQHGMSIDEIARQLGISPNTVKSHLSEALKSLRNHLLQSAIFLSVLSGVLDR